MTDPEAAGRVLPPRPKNAHKGSFGHVYVVAGSRGKGGAAIMAGLAALRSGAGLVTLWLPEGLQRDVVGKVPELMTEALPETGEGTLAPEGLERILAALRLADTVVVGPGVTTNADTRNLVHNLVRQSPVPVVIDADGLNAFALHPEGMRSDSGQPIIITPHPGEMSRLLGVSITEVQADRLATASEFARDHRCFTVLKGFQTVTATPSGRVFINPTGNPGMATGGTGDILSGIMGRFVAGWRVAARKTSSVRLMPGDSLGDHVAAAVYIHGLAGDLAAQEKGMESLIATDLIPFLPPAFKKVARG